MKKNQIKLPSRKWYSLQQAADKLTREFGVTITIDDLLHYYQRYYLTEKEVNN